MKKRTLPRIIIISGTLILVAALLSVALFSGRVEADITGDDGNFYLNIKSTYLTDFLEDRVNLKGYNAYFRTAEDGFERGESSGGVNSLKIKSGYYFGGSLQKEYKLHSYSSVKCVIILEKTNADNPSVVVFNLKTERKTKDFFEILKTKIE